MGLSWRERADAGDPIEIPCLDFGVAQWLLLPGESYVEFQLAAQRMRPDSFRAGRRLWRGRDRLHPDGTPHRASTTVT